MKILITARYVSGDSVEGGSSRFFKTVADTLLDMGHDVTCTTEPSHYVANDYDLIICSHVLPEIKANPALKILISHGIIKDERMTPGADRYISVSKEVRDINMKFGFRSEVVPQPIRINRYTRPGETLRKILIIRREPVAHDPFEFLKDQYEVRYSDLTVPIEDQIEWADLCITLGRGALESMAQGRPVLVADNRPYIGAVGDGYMNKGTIWKSARCNFSGRWFKHHITREWIEKELAKYNADDSAFLFEYVSEHHDAVKIVNQYLDNDHVTKIKQKQDVSVAFGVLVNDIRRLDMVFQQSQVSPDITAHIIKLPETACKGLNKLIDIMEADGTEIAVFAHQDMYFRAGWVEQMKSQIALLPDSWIVAGIIGKDPDGDVCGRLHDMRMPLHFSTGHNFPHPASCFDECCIILRLHQGFRFDEDMPGFDLYGTQAVCLAYEMGRTAWMIDAFAEHYCMRSFDWHPGKDFEACFKWLHRRFPPDVAPRIDTTVIACSREYSKPRYDPEVATFAATG